MKFVIFIICFFSAALSAAQVAFNPSKEILMEGSSCEELEAHAQSILAWTKQSTNTNYEMPQCYCSKTSCRMDVAPISPYFVKELTNYDSGFALASAYNGPNCFNAALVANETLPKISFTHPYEIAALLTSPLCREVPISDSLQPGDILVVRNLKEPYREIHAGIYLSPSLSFSKYGEASLMPYSYGLNADQAYGVKNDSCRRISGTPKSGDECFNESYVNFFRCDSLSSFVSKTLNSPEGLNKLVQSIYADASMLDIKISDIALKGDATTPEIIEQYQKNLIALFEKTTVVAENNSISSYNKSLARIMRYRVFSLYEQTRRIGQALGAGHLTSEFPHIEKIVEESL